MSNDTGRGPLSRQRNSRSRRERIKAAQAEASAWLQQDRERNGVKTDNRLENLEYCSASDNQRHAVATGLAPKPPLRRGTDNDHTCRLNEEQLRSIRRDYAEGRGIPGLAREYRVGDSTVRNIVRRNSWAWLSDE